VEDPGRREDALALVGLMREATGREPRMWGPSIVGSGRYAYTYDSGHSGEAPLAAFSPRKAEFALHLGLGDGRRDDLLARLGKHRAGKGCIYVKRLAAVDAGVLAEMVRESVATYSERWTVVD
jgi:hypothetical protein